MGKRTSLLAEYKRLIKAIENKGTVSWLKEFIKLVSDSSYFEQLMRTYKLSPSELYTLNYMVPRLEKYKHYEFIEKGVFDFLGNNGFSVEPHGIGYTVRISDPI